MCNRRFPRHFHTDAGTGVTNVNADQLDGHQGAWYQSATNLTGTVADARLSANVALRAKNDELKARLERLDQLLNSRDGGAK